MTSLFDIIVIIIILLGAITGYSKGFFKQLASLVGLVVGLFVACILYVSFAEKIYMSVTDSMTVAQIIAFVAIWLLVPLVFTLLASLLTNAFETLSLGWINRILGFALGAVKWALLIGILLNVLDYFDDNSSFLSETMKEESMLYYPIKSSVLKLFYIAKDFIEKIL